MPPASITRSERIAALNCSVIGAVAQDLIGHAAPSPHTEVADVNFKLDALIEHIGGCAANICYSLASAGHQPYLCAPTGSDTWQQVLRWTDAHGLPQHGLLELAGTPSSRAIIINHADERQTTYFYAGASPQPDTWSAHLNTLSMPDLVVQSAMAPDLMCAGLAWARQNDARLTLWNPGQYASWLNPATWRQAAADSHILVMNRSEFTLLEPLIATTRPEWMIISDGPRPVEIHGMEGTHTIDVPGVDVVDPTGCGDALIAGMLHALIQHADADSNTMRNTDLLIEAVQRGIAFASRCAHHHSAQGHDLSDLR